MKTSLDLALDLHISGQRSFQLKHPEDSWLFISQTQERVRLDILIWEQLLYNKNH